MRVPATRVLPWVLLGLAGGAVPWLLSLLPLSVSELARADELGLISATTRSGYPKAQELPVYLWFTLLLPLAAAALAHRQGHVLREVAASTRPRWLVLVVVGLLVGLAYDLGYIFEATPWGRFGFLGEEGVYLGTAQALAQGGRLYEDVFFPYGPLMGWPLPLATGLAGDELLGYRFLVWAGNQLGMMLVLACLWVLLRRRALVPGWLLLCGILCIPVLPNWNATTLRLALPVAAAVCAGHGALQRESGRAWCVTGGLLAALSAGFSFDGGAAGVVAVALCCLLPLAVDRSGPEVRRAVLWTALGASSVAVPLALALLLRGELLPALHTLRVMLDLPGAGYQALPWPDSLGWFKDVSGTRGPFPPAALAYAEAGTAAHAAEARTLALWSAWPWLVIGLGASLAGLALLGLRADGGSAAARRRAGSLVGLALVSVLLGRGALGRSDLYHLQFYGALPGLLCAAVLVEELRARSGRGARAAAVVLIGTALLAAGSWPPGYYAPGHAREPGSRLGWLDTDLLRIDRPRVRRISLPPALAEEVLAVHDWAGALPPDSTVWFYPSEASYYWITDRPLPHPYLWAYDAATRAQRAALVAELDERPPSCVLETEGTFHIDHIPAAELLPEVEAWLEARYVNVPDSAGLSGVRLRRLRELSSGACAPVGGSP